MLGQCLFEEAITDLTRSKEDRYMRMYMMMIDGDYDVMMM